MLQRILVADDAELNRALLREILEEDYIVDEACNGAETLEWLLEHRRHTAALLLDLRMPGMDGFSVIEEMKRNGWMNRIPVLIISSDDSVEVENRCLELGVSDFIHKPFDTSVVKNRVKNTLELFASKNQLETTVEEQAQTLKKQDQIIRFQAEKLREADTFHRLMMEYRAAIMEMETRFQILNAEFSQEYKRNPFESIKSRLKTPESIYEKLARKGFPMTVETIRERLADVAGVRVICSFPDDIYRHKKPKTQRLPQPPPHPGPPYLSLQREKACEGGGAVPHHCHGFLGQPGAQAAIQKEPGRRGGNPPPAQALCRLH